MTNANESAYGYGFCTADGNNVQDVKGLTKREYFAAMAMQGLLTNSNVLKFFQREGLNPNEFINLVAKDSTEIADALINALNETK